MEDFKQNATWFGDRAMVLLQQSNKENPSFLKDVLTPNYISPWHRILTAMLKDLGSRCVLAKERDPLQKGYGVKVRHRLINKVGKSC